MLQLQGQSDADLTSLSVLPYKEWRNNIFNRFFDGYELLHILELSVVMEEIKAIK